MTECNSSVDFPLSNDGISPEQALALAKYGSALIIQNFPKNAIFGIDMQYYTSGEKFMGVKMVPPGPHFIYYNSICKATNKEGPRSGFFHYFSSGQIIVRRWDASQETLVDDNLDEDELNKFRHHLLGDLDCRLSPYHYDTYKLWYSLSSYISEAVISKLSPSTKIISSVGELISSEFKSSKSKRCTNYKTDENGIPVMAENTKSKINYTDLSRMRYPPGCSPAELSLHCTDSSWLISTLIQSEWSGQWKDCLGELQFTFILLLVGQSYESFYHWRNLIRSFCTVKKSLGSLAEMYEALVSILYFQFEQVPEDIFVDIVENNNFLVSCLSELFDCTLAYENLDKHLVKKIQSFKDHLVARFNWEFNLEDFDDPPVIVSRQNSLLQLSDA